MAVSAFPSGETPDTILLNVTHLFTRLEHNLLSPGTELRSLRRSEFQRRRVTKNVEYARTLLTQLERSLPQLKHLDRRHEAQAEIARDRQLLKRMQSVLDEESLAGENDEDDADADADADDEWKELFSKPIVEVSPTPEDRAQQNTKTTAASSKTASLRSTSTPAATATAPAPAATATETTTTPTSTLAQPSQPTSTLRNRHTPSPYPPTEPAAKTTGSSTTPTDPKIATEKALDDDRNEQEDLTSSLIAMATQLKTQSQSFQETLETEKDALERAALGMDKTSSTMEAAGKRMGMLRRMTEGKGWWGRMMLYAWIFGLWVVAILIVFVGPKLRF